MTESQNSATGRAQWTREQDKAFENALNVWHDESAPDRWEQVAALVPGDPGKDAAEVQRHYELLQEDVRLIEAGRVPLPNYSFASLSLSEDASDSPPLKKGHSGGFAQAANGGSNGSKGVTASAKSADQERRKGIPWSEEEHRLFLLGLAKFGKGDWRSISRNFVISRTPTQVASHAQKYFIRLNSINKDKRRSSIHDITNVNNVGDAAMQQAHQGPITGQPGPGVMYQQQQQGPGQAVVGAPVMLPPPGYGRPVMAPHMAYPMQPQPGMHH